jgi:endonuclease/exonuclease/phosphatase (EEP) superfamily protein YafD
VPIADHDKARIDQAWALLDTLDNHHESSVIVGDLNNMHSFTKRAKLLAHPIVRSMIGTLPQVEPGHKEVFMARAAENKLSQKLQGLHYKSARIGSLAARLSGMAEGRALEVFESAGFVDADPNQQATMLLFGQFSLAQLDHIMARDAKVTEFSVLPKDGLSDHRAVAATITANI